MKKTLTIFLSMAVLLCTALHMVFAAATTEVDGMTYELNDSTKTATLTKGKDVETVEIPGSFNYNGADYNVTSIGEWSFNSYSSLASVTIGSGVKTIGNNAFYGCSGLTSVEIGSNVTTIGDHTFSNCSSLASVNIPNSVESIDSSAFRGCSKLASVTIGSGLQTISNDAFQNCENLKSITVDSDNKNFKVEDGVLLSKDDTRLVLCSKDKSGSYGIPNKVKSIDGQAFNYCKNLTSLTFSDSVESIGVYAFNRCSGLTSITIPCDFDKDKFNNNNSGIVVGDDNTFTVNVDGGEPKQGTFVLKHDWGEWEITSEPTCTTAGEKTGTCKREGCGTTVTEPVAATGHRLTKTEKVEPTCVDEGMSEYWECSECKLLFSDEAGTKGVTEKDLTLPKLEHDWDDGEVTTAATPEKPGEKTYKCSRCGETKTEQVEYVSVPGGGDGGSTDSQPDAAGGDNNSTNPRPDVGSGDSNSSNSYSDAEPTAIAKRAPIKTGDQLGVWLMFDMALLLLSAYGVLVGVRFRKKKDRK